MMVLIVGVLFAFVLKSGCDAWLGRSVAALAPDVRERIFQRGSRAESVFWMLDLLAMGVMVLGALKATQGISLLPLKGRWGIPVLVLGMALMGLFTVLRFAISARGIRAEAPGTPAAQRAVLSTAVLTLGEIALLSVVLTMVWPQINGYVAYVRGVPATGAATPGELEDEDAPAKSGTSSKKLPQWIDAPTALSLLKGRDQKYLDALVKKEHVRTEVQNGRTMYLSSDLTSMLDFPTAEELDLK